MAAVPVPAAVRLHGEGDARLVRGRWSRVLPVSRSVFGTGRCFRSALVFLTRVPIPRAREEICLFERDEHSRCSFIGKYRVSKRIDHYSTL